MARMYRMKKRDSKVWLRDGNKNKETSDHKVENQKRNKLKE